MVGALTQWKKRKKENKDREREWMVPFPLGSWIHTLRSQKPSVWLPTPGPHTLYHESLRWVRTYANMLATWRVLMSMVGPTRNQDLLLARHGLELVPRGTHHLSPKSNSLWKVAARAGAWGWCGTQLISFFN